LIIEPEDVERSNTTRFPFGGREPAGDCVNSWTNVPSIHVWHAMLFPWTMMMPRRIERSSNAARIDLK
jgi:hypothetical protein